MLTIKIPIWISSAYVTMRITSLPGSANRLPFLAAPVPIIAQRAALCQFSLSSPQISENRRLTRNGKTDILRPLSNRTRPEGGAQDDQRKHGLVRIGRKEAWTEGALRTHAALRSKTAFFCALSVFLQDGERFFCAFPKISFVL